MELVSIICPLYNAESYITDTINSVLAQTYTCWEMIIVDDMSTDNSVSIVRALERIHPNIKLINPMKKLGPAIARNLAIEYATGRFIAFLDADDWWEPSKLYKQVEFMLSREIALSYSAYRILDSHGKLAGCFVPKSRVNYYDMLKSSSIGCLTAMYDTAVLGKVYMPIIRQGQDYALWLKILKQIPYAEGIVEPLALYRLHDHSLSSKKIQSAKYQWKVYRDIENLGFWRSVYYFLQYAYYGIKKHYLN